MNEWLAHLLNPQLKSQQLQDLKGSCYHQSKALILEISGWGMCEKKCRLYSSG